MAVREGRWDCTSCGNQGLTPRDMSCGGCGSPRAEDVSFYLPEDAPVVTDEAELARATAGADWQCGYCGAGSPATVSDCSQCGAPRDEGKQREVKDHLDAAPVAPAEPKSSGAPAAKIGVGALLGCAALCCFLMIVAAILGGPKEQAVEVSGFSWERTIPVQENKPVVESAWSLPAGAKLTKQRQEVKSHREVFSHTETRTRKKKVQVGTKKVKVGKRDLGNGYFEDIVKDEPVYEMQDEKYQHRVMKKEPVYATKYEFEVMRWVTVRNEVARGSDQAPQWPALELAENQREGPRSEVYRLQLAGTGEQQGKSWTYELPEAQWKTYTQGQKVVATIGGGEVKKLGELKVEAE